MEVIKLKIVSRLKKNFTLRELPILAILFVVAVIVMSVGSDIVNTLRGTQTSDEYDYNVSTEGLKGLKQMSQWLEIIGLVVAASVVIGILFVYFARTGR